MNNHECVILFGMTSIAVFSFAAMFKQDIMTLMYVYLILKVRLDDDDVEC